MVILGLLGVDVPHWQCAYQAQACTKGRALPTLYTEQQHSWSREEESLKVLRFGLRKEVPHHNHIGRESQSRNISWLSDSLQLGDSEVCLIRMSAVPGQKHDRKVNCILTWPGRGAEVETSAETSAHFTRSSLNHPVRSGARVYRWDIWGQSWAWQSSSTQVCGWSTEQPHWLKQKRASLSKQRSSICPSASADSQLLPVNATYWPGDWTAQCNTKPADTSAQQWGMS